MKYPAFLELHCQYHMLFPQSKQHTANLEIIIVKQTLNLDLKIILILIKKIEQVFPHNFVDNSNIQYFEPTQLFKSIRYLVDLFIQECYLMFCVESKVKVFFFLSRILTSWLCYVFSFFLEQNMDLIYPANGLLIISSLQNLLANYNSTIHPSTY